MCSDCSSQTFYKAPSNIDETCMLCGHALKPDEIIGSAGDQYVHESCAEIQAEEMAEEGDADISPAGSPEGR